MNLVDRVRDSLAGQPAAREVTMFGGLAFLVSERMVVSVGRDGSLLVRVDPERSVELLATHGARPAEMGSGRAMGDSWISVAAHAVEAEQDLTFWLGVALDRHAKNAREPHRA